MKIRDEIVIPARKEHVRIGRYTVGRFRFLLVAIVSLFVLRPFLEGYARIGLLTDLFFCLILLSGANTFSHRGKGSWTALGIASPAFLLEVISHVSASAPIEIAKRIAFALFLAYVLVIILTHIFTEKEVTEDLITGAVCAYLLIGILWTFVFYFLELGMEGSFSLPKDLRHEVGAYLYYSFITMTTVGYGDIVPLTAPARSLAVLEAVMGQLYLAITIARLVGVHASRSVPDRG
jgi:hypothetical protein